jgi:hypothetical protein
MKKLALIVLAAASLVGTAGVASAQWYGGGYYSGGPGPYYGDPYRQRYYDDDRYYRRRYSRGSRAVDCYGRVCPWGFSVQDCVCKPYRGY